MTDSKIRAARKLLGSEATPRGRQEFRRVAPDVVMMDTQLENEPWPRCSGLNAVDDKCGEPVKEYSFGIRLGEMGPP